MGDLGDGWEEADEDLGAKAAGAVLAPASQVSTAAASVKVSLHGPLVSCKARAGWPREPHAPPWAEATLSLPL